MRVTCCLVLLLVAGMAGADPKNTRDVDVLIERAWSQWARPADTDDIAGVDRGLVPHVLHRAATEWGRDDSDRRSALLYDALNRRSAELHDMLMEHALTTANPWTAGGLARLSHDQLSTVIELLAHDDDEVADRADEALADVAQEAPALAARMAVEHRERLLGVLQAEHRRYPESVPGLLALARPPAVDAIPAVVAGMAHDDRLVRRRALSAFVILGIPSIEPAAALATILREEDGWGGRGWDAVDLVGERLGDAMNREIGAGSPEERRMLRRIALCLGVCDVFPVAYWTDLLAGPDPAVSDSALRVLLRFGVSQGVLIEHTRVRLRRYVEAEKETTLDGAPWLVGVMDACARFRGAGASLEPELRAAMRQSRPLDPAATGRAARAVSLAAAEAAVSLALVTGDVAAAGPAVVHALARAGLDVHRIYDHVASLGPAVTPYLLKALTTEGGDPHAGAVEMLGRISPPLQGVPEALVAVLGRGHHQRVQTALSKLGHAAVPAVVVALGNPSRTIRAHAAETLGMMDGKLLGARRDMHPHLHRCLYDMEFGVSAAAMRALLASGANAGDALGPLLLSDHVATRRHAARGFSTLAHADPPGTRDLLISSLDDADDIVRAAAARVLGDLRPTAVQAVPRLKEMLGDEAPSPRTYAARALWYLGAPAEDMVDPLIMATADGDALVRVFAAGALGTIATRDEERIEAWTKIVADAVQGVPQDATSHYGLEATRVAVWNLGSMGSAACAAVPILEALALSGRDSWSRIAAVAALGQVGACGDRATPTLIHLAAKWTRKADYDLATYALSALRDVGTDTAIEARVSFLLAGFLHGRDYILRNAEHMPLELDMLTDALSSDDLSVRCNAATALGGLGAHGAPALFALETATGHDDEAMREAAEIAIDRIRDDIRQQQERSRDE
jgi:HEAT repeat protein